MVPKFQCRSLEFAGSNLGQPVGLYPSRRSNNQHPRCDRRPFLSWPFSPASGNCHCLGLWNHSEYYEVISGRRNFSHQKQNLLVAPWLEESLGLGRVQTDCLWQLRRMNGFARYLRRYCPQTNATCRPLVLTKSLRALKRGNSALSLIHI